MKCCQPKPGERRPGVALFMRHSPAMCRETASQHGSCLRGMRSIDVSRSERNRKISRRCVVSYCRVCGAGLCLAQLRRTTQAGVLVWTYPQTSSSQNPAPARAQAACPRT